MTNFAKARLLALLLPLALMAGALGSQFIGHLVPCEMCVWQRWPHVAAIVVALLAFVVRPRPVTMLFVLFAGVLIALSGAIGVFHAGVELGWWEGITQCTATGARSLQDILNTPLVRCDQVQWSFLGVSMAGWNAIISLAGAALIVLLARRKPA